MTRNSKHGDWTKLTYYLRSRYPNVVTLTDEQIAEITGSTDIRQTDSFFPFDVTIQHGV